MAKLKIVSDGGTNGTQVILPDGSVIYPKNVRFSQNGGEPPVVILELIGMEFEGSADMAAVVTDELAKGA